MCLDHFRRVNVRLGREADVEEHSELLPQPELQIDLDEEQLIQLALTKVEEDAAAGRIPESLVVIARYLAEGKTYAEIAKLTGSTEAAVKMQASRLRSHLRKHWGKWVAGVTSVGIVVLFVMLGRRPVVPGSEIGPDNVAMSATATTARPAASSIGPGPVALRALAVEACQDQFYEECERRLDQAKAADPTSESLPEVKELRETIAKWNAQPSAPPQGPLKPDKAPRR